MSMVNDDQVNIPHLFKCPISLDLFQDPVTLCTGQTYDRSNIEKWLAAGNLTCPVTMQKLQDLSLVPNHTLQHLIHHWLCMDHNFKLNPPQPKQNSFDPTCSLAFLKQSLESQDLSRKIEILRKIRLLSGDLEWRRSYLIELGFFPLLLQLAFRKAKEGKLLKEDSDIAEEALHCVMNLLPFCDKGCLDMIREESHLAAFLILLQQGSVKLKMNLCYLIGVISSCLSTRELCLMLGQTQCLVRGLINLLHDNTEASEAANKASSSFCALQPNRESFVREGGVDGLLAYLSAPDKRSQASVALTTLELLLESDAARTAVANNPNGIRVLVKMVFGVCFDQRGSESAVSSLCIVCNENVKVREEAISAGVLTQLLLLLQSQCSSRAKNKARMLLKLLRSK